MSAPACSSCGHVKIAHSFENGCVVGLLGRNPCACTGYQESDDE